MFKQKTPEGWKKPCAFFPALIKKDKYGNETLTYAAEPERELNVCWHTSDSKAEQAEYGGRVNEILEAVFFYEDEQVPEIKENDRFKVEGKLYKVIAAVSSLSFLSVTIERVR